MEFPVRHSLCNPSIWSDAVHFIPFVGLQYEDGLVDGLRVLVLGESHFVPDIIKPNESRTFTVTNFEGFMDEEYEIHKGNEFWGKIQRIVARDIFPSRLQSAHAWRHVAYANFVQGFVGTGARQRPTKKLWDTGNPALQEILSRLVPDIVLVLGAGTWNNIIIGKDSESELPVVTGKPRKIWLLPHSNDIDSDIARSTWIYHPSSGREKTAMAINIFSSLLRSHRRSVT